MRHLTLMLGLLLAPVAMIAPQSAAAQMEGSMGCTTSERSTERYRTREYRVTEQHMEFQNTCPAPVKFYFCVSPSSDPASCAAIAQFQMRILQPGETTRMPPNRSGGRQYYHNVQCDLSENLIDWRSMFNNGAGPRCKGPVPPALTAAYPGRGTPPDPALPAATLANPQVVASALEYPRKLMNTLAEGRTVALVGVDAAGAATGCSIKSSSGYYQLDQLTCFAFSLRGRFVPPTDASGAAIPGVYEAKVSWATP